MKTFEVSYENGDRIVVKADDSHMAFITAKMQRFGFQHSPRVVDWVREVKE